MLAEASALAWWLVPAPPSTAMAAQEIQADRTAGDMDVVARIHQQMSLCIGVGAVAGEAEREFIDAADSHVVLIGLDRGVGTRIDVTVAGVDGGRRDEDALRDVQAGKRARVVCDLQLQRTRP